MEKQDYISADYSTDNSVRVVVFELHMWRSAFLKNFGDMAKAVSVGISMRAAFRICNLKSGIFRH